jgi:hypothetical protein
MTKPVRRLLTGEPARKKQTALHTVEAFSRANPAVIADRDRRRALELGHVATANQIVLGDPLPWQSALSQRQSHTAAPACRRIPVMPGEV